MARPRRFREWHHGLLNPVWLTKLLSSKSSSFVRYGVSYDQLLRLTIVTVSVTSRRGLDPLSSNTTKCQYSSQTPPRKDQQFHQHLNSPENDPRIHHPRHPHLWYASPVTQRVLRSHTVPVQPPPNQPPASAPSAANSPPPSPPVLSPQSTRQPSRCWSLSYGMP